jgi:triosephosphate isomerase
MRVPLVAGNWKMHGGVAQARELARAVVAGLPALRGIEVAVCPPFVLIPTVSEVCAGTELRLGAQDMSEYASGAYTGEVSGSMLKDYNCAFAIIGHSERRHIFGESDARVAAKFRQAQASGIIPIVCVGETIEERRAGSTERVVARQLDAVLAAARAGDLTRTVIAYEPVWAIGTGETATPRQAQEVHAMIRARLRAKEPNAGDVVRIVYGGSVKPGNAAELFAMPDVDGGLIGGASLAAADFLKICQAASIKTAGG